MGRDRRSAGSAERPDRVQPALGVKPAYDLGGAAAHRLDRRGTIAGSGENLDVGTRCGGHLLTGDVGSGQRLVKDARVDQQDVDAARARIRSRKNAYS